MAGSRLFLQASVLLELLLLIYVAVEWGLCPSNDRVCLLLIPNKQHTGRELIEETAEFPSELSFVPRLTIVVSSSRKTVHTTTTNSGDFLEFKTDEALRNKLCDRNTELDDISAFLSQSDQPHDNLESTVWICDPLLHDNNPTSSLGRVQVKSGVTLLYPSTDDVSVETLLGALLPTRSKRLQSRPRLTVLLALEETNEWQMWAMALAEYMEDEAMHSPHACWKDPIQFQVDSNVHLASNLKQTVTSTPTDAESNLTFYKMPAASLHDTFLRIRQHNDEYLHIVLYVPHSTPLLVFDETGTESSSKAFASDKDVIAILDQTSLEGSDRVAILRDVWVYVSEFLSKQCYQMTPIHDDKLLQMDHSATTTTFPAWQQRLWLQRILQDSYNLATMELSKQRHMLLNLPSTVYLARDHVVSQEWKLAEACVQEALLHAANEEWWKALVSLEQAIQRLQTLERDPTLREPLDLLPQHYMAVFAPLLFPLLLPFVAGVIREFKRYRKLQSAKTE